MNFEDVLNKRRALRTLDPVNVDDELISELAAAAGLAPSCANKQPWRFVFVYEKSRLDELMMTLPRGNAWALKASMIVAVTSKPDLDCVMGDRRYYQFDTGMAAAMLMLKATDLGLVAHPIAGFDPAGAAAILNLPQDYELITLIVMGKQTDRIDDELPDEKKELEKVRPARKPLNEIAFHNQFELK